MFEAGDLYTGTGYQTLNPTWHAEDALWKAALIARILRKNDVHPGRVVDIGCGTGGVLNELLNSHLPSASGVGYDIAPHPIEIGSREILSRIELKCGDFTQSNEDHIDLLLCIDVFEHVDDYIGFLRKLSKRSTYFVFHIPLDMNLKGLLRGHHMSERRKVGHLHYFDKDTALATLDYAGFMILDTSFTHKSDGRFITSVIQSTRAIVQPLIGRDRSIQLVGGHSLLVLAAQKPRTQHRR